MADTETTAVALSDKLVATLPPGEHTDDGAPGLRLRVTASGVRVFRWGVKVDGRVKWITIGRWSPKPRAGHVSVNQARARLDKAKAAHKAGTLDALVAEWNPPRAKPAHLAEGALTVRDLAEAFRPYIARRRRRPEVVDDVLKRDVLPVLGGRPVASITTPDVRRLVDGVVNRGAATHAGRVLQVVGQLFRFAQGRGDIVVNPAEPLDAGALGVVHNVCDRVLSADEIPAFWTALGNSRTPTVKNALRLLLLLGVRSGELLLAEWPEVNFDDVLPNGQPKPEADRRPMWTIPAEHRKLTIRAARAAKPLRIPLPPTALAIFRELKALADSIDSRYVLASFAGAGKALTDKSLNHSMRRLFEGESPALTFKGERPTPHDLRRTVRTGLAALGVAPHVAEACLGHSLGRIVAIYDTHDYLDERRDALARWDAHVMHLVTGKGADVVAHPKAVRS